MAKTHGPVHGITGDMDEPTQLPETKVAEENLAEERQMAGYARTEEYKRIKDFLQLRIKFFQRYFPTGTPVENLTEAERSAYWQAAAIIIKEYQQVIDDYDSIRRRIKEHDSQSSHS